MTELEHAWERLECWLRTFGQKSQPPFQADLRVVLDAARRLLDGKLTDEEVENLGAADSDVDRLNRQLPIGTPVRYYPGPRDHGYWLTRVRSTFFRDLHTNVVVFVKGQPGYVLASHVQAVEGQKSCPS